MSDTDASGSIHFARDAITRQGVISQHLDCGHSRVLVLRHVVDVIDGLVAFKPRELVLGDFGVGYSPELTHEVHFAGFVHSRVTWSL